jgi:two-component system LytT family sensor kinase
LWIDHTEGDARGLSLCDEALEIRAESPGFGGAPGRAYTVWIVLAALHKTRTRWAIALALWPLLAVAVATQNYVYKTGFRLHVTWLDQLRYPAVEYLFWALAAPLIYELALRWGRKIAILACWALALDIVHALYRASLHSLVYPPTMVPWSELVKYYAIGNLFGDLWLFATIAALAQMVQLYLRYEAREREWSAGRLQALEAQLHPHFLFNALNSIATLMHEDVDAADEMMTKLATLLRRTLNQDGAYEIPLREELEILEIYLDIQRTRFQDRLTTKVDADHAALEAMVPRLILQPLVENAVRHGISRRTGPGRIEVRAWLAGGQLKMTVLNDGAGWSERGTPGGLGLANTRARLAQHFEDRYRFALREGGERGAVAEVEIPFRR